MADETAGHDLLRPRLEGAVCAVAVRGGGYFPVLVKLQDGSLGAVVRGGAPHIGIGGRLDWIRSADGGRTWSEPAVIVDSEWDDRNPALGQMPDGTIVMAYSEARTYDERGEWDTSAGEYVMFYVLSHDNGATWTEKRLLYPGAVRGGSPFGRVIMLCDGTALMPIYGGHDPAWRDRPRADEVKTTMSAIVRSRDNGRTWEDFSVVSPTGHNEMSLVALSDERLIAVVRTDAGSLDQFDSSEAGYTWAGPKPLTQPGQHPGDIARLASGRLLIVWGNRREPIGVGAMVSDDEGQAWRYDERVMLAWTSLNTDCGYPSVIQLEDGMVVTMYYSVGTTDLGEEEMAVVVRFSEAHLP